jgi:serine/threonine-protein kinase ULK/ATG1
VNNCYIISEYCNDGDMASLLKARRRLPEPEALALFREIYEGFQEMAGQNILHRDLKPANIFLRDGHAKIADFGFARVAGNPAEKEHYNVGTPLYMSPESLRKNVYSVKNDIWSLGVILY